MKIADIQGLTPGLQKAIGLQAEIHSLSNRVTSLYSLELKSIRTSTGDDTLEFNSMTDEQIVEYILGGVMDAELLADVKAMLVSNEVAVKGIDKLSAALTTNDIEI